MKISKIGIEGVYNNIQLKIKNVDQKKAEQSNKNGLKEDIRVSIKEEIKGYKEIIKGLPEVRKDRIQELKKAIKQGAYKVDTKEVAKGILEDILLGVK